MEGFKELQKKKLLPVEFITFWGVHKRMRAAVTQRPLLPCPALQEVVADTHIVTKNLAVETTPSYFPYPHECGAGAAHAAGADAGGALAGENDENAGAGPALRGNKKHRFRSLRNGRRAPRTLAERNRSADDRHRSSVLKLVDELDEFGNLIEEDEEAEDGGLKTARKQKQHNRGRRETILGVDAEMEL